MWLNVCNFFWMYGVFHAQVHIHYILENFITLPPCLLTVSYYTCTSAWNFPLSITCTILLTVVKNFFVTEKLIIILFQLYITGGWDSSWFWMGRESQRGRGTLDWMEKAEVSLSIYISFRIWSTMLSYMYHIHLQSFLAYFVKNVNSSSECNLLNV